MKSIRFRHDGGISYGALEGDIARVWSAAPWAGGTPTSQTIAHDRVQLLAPCEPGKVIAIAINYPGATGLTAETREPLVFFKPPSSVIGPGEVVSSPFVDSQAWGEVELAVVIGKRLRNVSTAEACESIFGFTLGNDVSAENLYDWDHHLARSKGPDTFCPLGPWIDTDFVPDENRIHGYHNDNIIRDGRLNQRLWREPELLVWLSSWMTLEPGDVILTGAPTRTRPRQYLRNGDVFRCVIDRLGELSNPYRDPYA